MISLLRGRFALHSADGRLYAVLAACGFSLKAVFVKLAYAAGPVDALTLLALRMGFALPIFLWLLHKSANVSAPRLTRVDMGHVLLLAFLGYYLSSLFDFQGLVYITAGLERLILYVYPTLVLLMQAWMNKRRPDAKVAWALAICYLGLAIAFGHDIQQSGHGANVLTGAAWVFASAVTYALYYLGTGAVVTRLGSTRLAGLAGSASCVLVIAHFLLLGRIEVLSTLPLAVWTYALLMALISTVLPIWWLSMAIQRLGAERAATVGTLGPVLTIFAAWLLLAEPLSVLQLVGLGLVMLGVLRLKPPASTVKPEV
ncbi:MAG: EamA family transporter [Burkholderiales bacterium]|nr:EamA family transporter [Burkholderiales bacterium]